jgi:hypothetical protein
MSLLLTPYKTIIDNTLATIANTLLENPQIVASFTKEPLDTIVKGEGAVITSVLRFSLNTAVDLAQFQYACVYLDEQLIETYGDQYIGQHEIRRFFTSKMIGTTYRIYVIVSPTE